MATKAKDKVPKTIIIPSNKIPDYDLEVNPCKIKGEKLKLYTENLKHMLSKNKSKPLI
tara:strand:- start:3905 stop:4078 length:174 start_codon:yes stop_codon:yes gene_type:complete